MRHIKFCRETRYPGCYRMDDNWKVFVNSTYDLNAGKWEMKKIPYVQLIK